MSPFQLSTTEFPRTDLAGQLMIPRGHQEEYYDERLARVVRKWTRKVVFVSLPSGDIQEIGLEELIRLHFGEDAELAGVELVNFENGRQVNFGLHPESKPGNTFTSIFYGEYVGGGSTLVAYAKSPSGIFFVALVLQLRPLMFQRGLVRQVVAGYPLTSVKGSTEDVHRATSVAEGSDELLGEGVISVGDVFSVGAPYNTNNGYVLTGEGQGIGVQLVEIPWDSLVRQDDGTYKPTRDRLKVKGRELERIYDEMFVKLDHDLLQEVSKPSDGSPACTKTETAIDRTYKTLVLGIDLRS